jgi:hypothetical protein
MSIGFKTMAEKQQLESLADNWRIVSENWDDILALYRQE